MSVKILAAGTYTPADAEPGDLVVGYGTPVAKIKNVVHEEDGFVRWEYHENNYGVATSVLMTATNTIYGPSLYRTVKD